MGINNGQFSHRVFYTSHGAGPLPLLGDESHGEMLDCLQHIATTFEKPSAILVISAHWEAAIPTITSGEHPPLIYDYYGFPRESYEIQYPAPGDPGLAQRIYGSLKKKGIDAVLDDARGFDHGLFVPLKIMYPGADIPCVQLSLVNSLSAVEHIRIGTALAGLEKHNVLVVGSGFSFHNLQAFLSPPTSEIRSMNEAFEQWLMDTSSNPDLSENERTQRLVNWERAPHARFCHPREEHLLPLHVCYGMAQSPATRVFTFEIMGIQASCYLW